MADGEREAGRLSFAELERQARAIAARLLEIAQPQERALLVYPTGLSFVSALFGCFKSGLIAVPVPPPDPHRIERTLPRLLAVVEDAEPAVILTSAAVAAAFERENGGSRTLERARWILTDRIDGDLAETFRTPEVRKDQIAVLQYTSGSTSAPKGVMVSHANVLANSHYLRAAWGYSPETVSLTWVPNSHDDGVVNGLIQPVFSGNCCVLMPPMSVVERPIRWLRAISRYRVNQTGGPNFVYALCIRKTSGEERQGLDLSSWSMAYNAAEPIRYDTLRLFFETFKDHGFKWQAFYPAYGLAEATLIVSTRRRQDEPVLLKVRKDALFKGKIEEAPAGAADLHTLVGCGHPISDNRIVILDPETGERLPEGRLGEVLVTSRSIAEGYWRRDQETAATFLERTDGRYLRTGDLGFLHAGELFINGRLKDLIIIRGRNVYPHDVELSVERAHPAVRAGCAAAFSVDLGGEERLVTLAELDRRARQEKDFRVDDVVRAIRRAVSEEHALEVASVVLLAARRLPKTSSGKLKRGACRDAFLADRFEPVGVWSARGTSSALRAPETAPRPRSVDVERSGAEAPGAKAPSAEAPGTGASGAKVSVDILAGWIVDWVREELGLTAEEIDLGRPITELGLDSLRAVDLAQLLGERLGRQLEATLLWRFPTVDALARHLSGEEDARPARALRTRREVPDEAVAIVGMGCRFPGGASNPESFWRLLEDGVDAVTEVPPDRWDIGAFYDPDPGAPGKMYTRHGGFLEEITDFDPGFFGISPEEAAVIDPQQRLLLEVAWEALENAAIAPQTLSGSTTGVFIGLSMNDYSRYSFAHDDLETIDGYRTLGAMGSLAAGRLAYILGLQGPALQLDTSCSSSLLAIHQARESLLRGECDLALAGGVNLILSPNTTIGLCRMRALAPDGRSKTFDARADGYVRGEGCGIVVLARLRDARRRDDNVWAVLRGSATNHDGRSNGLTAPSRPAQEAVVRRALHCAGVKPREIRYVETHGTGTLLGDPVEVLALGAVLGEGRSAEEKLALGSVKTNLGHLESAAGVAGLMKAVLALHHGALPPHLHLEEPNPHIPWSELPVWVPTEAVAWPADPGRRLAGVSSFGMSGTNVHMIVESPPEARPDEARPDAEDPGETAARDRPCDLLTLAARSETALRKLAGRYAAWTETHPEAKLEDICFTARVGRAPFDHRLALVAGSREELSAELAAFAAAPGSAGSAPGNALVHRRAKSTERPRIAFLFTGQGAQYAGMGRELYAASPVFRASLERCDAILRDTLDPPLLDILASREIHQTAYTQPALFALEFALAELWRSWGVEPAWVLGHSIGEYVAASLAGILSLEDALAMAAERGRLMQALPRTGAMAAVSVSEARAREALRGSPEVAIAAVNGPERIVISGEAGAVQQICERFRDESVETKDLRVSHAFHSPLMEPMLEPFAAAAGRVRFFPPKIPLVSNLTGRLADDGMMRPEYWVRQIRETVRFADGVATLADQGCDTFLEIGPKPILLALARRSLPAGSRVYLPSLRRGQSDWRRMLLSLGELAVRGVAVKAQALTSDGARRLRLPTYPFERRSCRVDPPATGRPNWPRPKHQNHPLLGRRLPLAGSSEKRFAGVIDRGGPAFLAEHRVFDTPVLPATAYLEMAAAAAGFEKPLLERVTIENALLLPEGERRFVQVVLEPDGPTAFHFAIWSASGTAGDDAPWTRHARGKVRAGDDDEREPRGELERLRADVTDEVDVEDYYRNFRRSGLHYGPAFQTIERLCRRRGEGLARIRLPTSVDRGAFLLHPALLDGCLQVMQAAFPDAPGGRDGLYLPVGCERLRVYRRPDRTGFCHARIRPAKTAGRSTLIGDVLFFDDDGEPSIRLDGVSVLRANREAFLDAQKQVDDVYEMSWRSVPRGVPASQDGVSSWLIFADQGGLGQRLAELLREKGERPIVVDPGEAYGASADDEYRLDPASPGDFARLCDESLGEEHPPCRHIVHLWSLDLDTDPEEDPLLSCGSVLHLLQALARGGRTPTPRLTLLTRGAQPVGAARPLRIAQAPLWGLGRVIAVERPELRCRLLDLDPDSGPEDTPEILRELTTIDVESQIALRSGERYAARFLRDASPTSREPFSLRRDRTYLITGGLGELGLQVAAWALERGARHLLLIGRSAASAAARRAIDRLERKGARVLTARVDVTDAPALRAFLARIAREKPPLAGLVHAAGMLDDAVLVRQDWDRFERVLAPKVRGAFHLHTATAEMELDFFVGFSSAAALLGAPGQGNYAAANAFLDALAHHRRALGLPGTSVNWGPWAEVGMAAELHSEARRRWSDLGVASLRLDRGLEALGEVLSRGARQSAVLSVEWAKFLPRFFQGAVPPVFEDLDEPRQEIAPRDGPALIERLNETSEKDRRALLLREIRSRAAGILKLGSDDELEPRRNLFDLGFDSLMAIELKNALESSFGCEVRPTLVFDHPTVEEIESHLAAELFGEASPATEQSPSSAAEDPGEVQVLFELDLGA